LDQIFETKNMKQLLAILCLAFLMSACGGEATTANHDAALPHNQSQSADLSAADLEQLAKAKGKEANSITAENLDALIQGANGALFAFNFWKTNCEECIKINQILQDIQSDNPEMPLKIVTINLDSEEESAAVNQLLRTKGLTGDAMIINEANIQMLNGAVYNGKVPLPMLLLRNASEEIDLKYQQPFEIEELFVVMQSLI